MTVISGVEAFLRQVRHAVRARARSPGFSLAVVSTLALGIGADSAVFSAVDAVLLRPLPFPDSDRLVRVMETQKGAGETPIAPVRLEDWNRLSSSFEGITGYYTQNVSDLGADPPQLLREAFVAPRFLEVLRVKPALGRGFGADEYRFGGPAAALISDRYWRERFGGDPNVLGAAVRLGSGSSRTIVGVMPASFAFPDRDVDLWVPVPLGGPATAPTRSAPRNRRRASRR